MQAPRFGGFCFGGVLFRSKDDYGTRAYHFARVRSVAQNTVAFKEANANPSDSRHLHGAFRRRGATH
jgi:hypothetical protein